MASVKKVVKSKGAQEMAATVEQKFNNNSSGEFCADSLDEATQIDLNCYH